MRQPEAGAPRLFDPRAAGRAYEARPGVERVVRDEGALEVLRQGHDQHVVGLAVGGAEAARSDGDEVLKPRVADRERRHRSEFARREGHDRLDAAAAEVLHCAAQRLPVPLALVGVEDVGAVEDDFELVRRRGAKRDVGAAEDASIRGQPSRRAPPEGARLVEARGLEPRAGNRPAAKRTSRAIKAAVQGEVSIQTADAYARVAPVCCAAEDGAVVFAPYRYMAEVALGDGVRCASRHGPRCASPVAVSRLPAEQESLPSRRATYQFLRFATGFKNGFLKAIRYSNS